MDSQARICRHNRSGLLILFGQALDHHFRADDFFHVGDELGFQFGALAAFAFLRDLAFWLDLSKSSGEYHLLLFPGPACHGYKSPWPEPESGLTTDRNPS